MMPSGRIRTEPLEFFVPSPDLMPEKSRCRAWTHRDGSSGHGKYGWQEANPGRYIPKGVYSRDLTGANLVRSERAEVWEQQMTLERGESEVSAATGSRPQFLGAGAMLTVGAAVAASPKACAAETADFEGFVLNDKIKDDSLIRIQKSGVPRVGISVDPPYAYVDQATGNYSGIDAEIVQFIMKMLKIPK
jgi:hypothetical protein